MIELITQLPENLYQQVETIATEENLSLDQVITLALSAQVQAWLDRNNLASRAQRGSWEDFQAILAKVPDREPDSFDQLWDGGAIVSHDPIVFRFARWTPTDLTSR
jgi:hypothetical protein